MRLSARLVKTRRKKLEFPTYDRYGISKRDNEQEEAANFKVNGSPYPVILSPSEVPSPQDSPLTPTVIGPQYQPRPWSLEQLFVC